LGISPSNNVVLPVVTPKRSQNTWSPFTHTDLPEAGFWRPIVCPSVYVGRWDGEVGGGTRSIRLGLRLQWLYSPGWEAWSVAHVQINTHHVLGNKKWLIEIFWTTKIYARLRSIHEKRAQRTYVVMRRAAEQEEEHACTP
jgi:hypothetical protein